MFKLHHSGPFLKADNFKKARFALLAMLIIASTTMSSLAQTATPTEGQATATPTALSPAQAYFEPGYRQLAAKNSMQTMPITRSLLSKSIGVSLATRGLTPVFIM